MINKCLLGFFVLWSCMGYAQTAKQEISASAGGTLQGASIQLDWTLGEVTINTIQGTNYQLTQGFHQPRYVINYTESLPSKIGQFTAFPNPSNGLIKLKIELQTVSLVRLELYALNGQLLWQQDLEGQQLTEQLDFQNFPAGSYYLRCMAQEESTLINIQKLN